MFVIKLIAFGVEEEVTISDDSIILAINSKDYKTRLKFVENINVETANIADELQLIAALVNNLAKEKLTPDKKRALTCFLENKLKELK